MRILLTSLLLLAGLNLILARSLWNPRTDYFDYDLFRIPSNKLHDDFSEFMLTESSEEELKDEINALDSANLFNFDNANMQKIEENIDDNDSEHEESVKELADDDDKHEEDDKSLVLLILVNDDVESDKMTPNTDVEEELVDLTKSSEEKINDDQDSLTITEKDIKELTEFLVALNAIDELLKISDDNIKIMSHTSSEEKQFKGFDDFLKSMFELIEEEDEQIGNDSKEDNNDDDVTTTTPKNDSSEEDDVTTTTPKNDSSEEDDVTTPKPNSEEDKDNDNDSEDNEFDTINIVLHGIDDTERNENLDNHKYEIVDTFKPTSSPYIPEVVPASSANTDDQNIIQQYVEIREDLDTEQYKFKMNKLNLDKDFYNIISSNYNDEGIKKFENDVNVLHENYDRIKRHINGMENLNTKLYFKKLITAAIKSVQNNSKDLMANN